MAQEMSRNAGTHRIGLCLSGGGFRATFFHLGVVKLLWDAGLFPAVKVMCSVSGGSILAAKIALRWNDYVTASDEVAFYRAVLDVVKLGQSDLRGRIVRRWLLFGLARKSFSRTRLLERYYSDYLEKAELGNLSSSPPECHFLATSFTTGKFVEFVRRGFHDGATTHLASQLPLALAVAASSAFPPLFPPVTLSRKKLNAKVKDFPLESEYLTDGGIADNLGITRMTELAGAGDGTSDVDVILVSNASAPFDWIPTRGLWHIVARTARATDIMMSRMSALEERTRSSQTLPIVELPIEDVVNEADIAKLTGPPHLALRLQDQEVQKLVAHVRTDLDTFSLEEICSLVRHGYEVALKRCLQGGLVPKHFRPRDPCLYSFPSITWPMHESVIALIPVARPVIALQGNDEWMTKSQVKTKATVSALLGQASDPPKKTSDEDFKLIATLRLQLAKSSNRSYVLWNATDWTSWLLAGLIALAVLAIAWLIRN